MTNKAYTETRRRIGLVIRIVGAGVMASTLSPAIILLGSLIVIVGGGLYVF